jgi:hypothetical protein
LVVSDGAIGFMVRRQHNQRPENKRWQHPVTLLVLSSLVGFAGWLGQNALKPESDVRAEIADPAQLDSLPKRIATPVARQAGSSTPHHRAGASPATEGVSQTSHVAAGFRDPRQDTPLVERPARTAEGQIVYCDTMQASLVVGHNQKDAAPVTITRIAVNVAPVSGGKAPACVADALKAKPQGIAIRDAYLISLDHQKVEARFIGSSDGSGSVQVSPRNILENQAHSETINFAQNEPPLVRDVYIVARDPGLRRVWFSIYYDAEGAKVFQTAPVYITGVIR